MSKYSELDVRLSVQTPLSREWHSTLSELAQKLIDNTSLIREKLYGEWERHCPGSLPVYYVKP